MKKHLAPVGLPGIWLIGLFAITSLLFSIFGSYALIFHENQEATIPSIHLPPLRDRTPFLRMLTEGTGMVAQRRESTSEAELITKPPSWWSWHMSFLLLVALLVILYYIRYLELEIQQKKLIREQKHNERLRLINQAMSKFVPTEFLRALGRKRITDVARGDHVEGIVTVLFSDIRDYTALSETMTPEENYKFVNALMGRLGPAIKQHGGFVNQFLGDAIMAIFPNSTEDALLAAVDMQKSMRAYNLSRKNKGRVPVQIGIGVHTGSIIMGIIGDENRLDAAIISDTVNTTSRIENLTRYYGAHILISENSIRGAQLGNGLKVRYLGRVRVKGKQEHLGIYECLCGESPEHLLKRIATQADFEAGMRLFLAQQFKEAAWAFCKVLHSDPQDKVAAKLLERTHHYLQTGVPKEWNGVELMEEK